MSELPARGTQPEPDDALAGVEPVSKGTSATADTAGAPEVGSRVRPDGTWTDDGPGQSGPVISDRQAQLEQQRHFNSLQSKLLLGLGVLFAFTLLVVVIGPGVHAISEDFAKSLAQIILPVLLGFGGAIVGTLFAGNGKK